MLWLCSNFFSFFPWKILTSVLRGAIIMRSKKYRYGLVAQLGAHHIRIVGVVGSNPIRSTKNTISIERWCFLITRKFRYNLPLIPKTAARYFPQQRHSIHSVLNLRARITVQNNCSHRQQVHPPVFLTSHHHGQISHPQARYRYSEP